MTKSATRRSVLQTLLIGAGAAPTLRPFGRSFLPQAHAAEGGAPRRVILFEHPNGLPGGGQSIPESWYYKAGTSYATGVFGHMLKPLEMFRDQMVVIQNLEQKNAPMKDTSSHNNYSIQLWTGSAEAEKVPPHPSWGKARNASIDFHMSEKIGKLATPRCPLLGLGVQPDQTHVHDYTGNQVRGSIERNPYALYTRLFDGLFTAKTQPDPQVMARLANRKSVLDYCAKEATAFAKRLGTADRARAEAQAETCRALEKQLSAGFAAPGSGQACGPLALEPNVVWTNHITHDVPKVMNMMIDITVTALACDLTRVVEFKNWGRDDHDATSNFAPINLPQGWHALSHNDPSVEDYKRAKIWMSEQVAALCRRLSSIPETGGTMLDNTLVVVGSEHGQDHAGYPMQFMTIGGKNLGVKTGQYIRAGEPRKGLGVEHNRLLVSILNAMGLPEETWGVQDAGRGGLAGFMG